MLSLTRSTMPIPYQQASLHSPPSSITTANKWGPYSNARDFSANMVITLVVLFCGLLLAVAINAAIRFVLCARRRHRTPRSEDPEKQASGGKDASSPSEALPTLIFSTGTKLSGAEAAECAICISDFVEGDGVRVMPTCNHGFHVQCVERWLAAKRSCPTCRASYPVSTPAR